VRLDGSGSDASDAGERCPNPPPACGPSQWSVVSGHELAPGGALQFHEGRRNSDNACSGASPVAGTSQTLGVLNDKKGQRNGA
jgi:hypothetical protein